MKIISYHLHLIPFSYFFILLNIWNFQSCANGEKIPLAAIFEQGTSEIQTAFKYALMYHNTNDHRDELQAYVDIINTADAFKLSRIICNQFARGVLAMVGSMSSDSFQTFHSYSNTFQMPFVTPWFPTTMEIPGMDFSTRIQPSDLHSVLLDTIEYYGWKNIIYLYNTHEGLLRLQSVFQRLDFKNDSLRVTAVKKINNAKEAVSILRNIEVGDRWSKKFVILDCPTPLAKDVIISHVRDVHLGRRTYHYLLAGLAFDDPWDESIVEFSAVNITGFRIVDPNRPIVKEFLRKWKSLDATTFPGAGTNAISASAAFMYDGVTVLKEAFTQILNFDATSLRRNASRLFTCGSVNPDAIDSKYLSVKKFEHGELIARELRKVEIEGLTGPIQFTDKGQREGYTIDLMEMTARSEKKKIGEWKQGLGLKAAGTTPKYPYCINGTSCNITYVVTSIIEEPFLSTRKGENGEMFQGNDRYEGFCKDLADLIAKKLNITYELRIVKDNMYGVENPNSPGGWDGMVGELIRKEAHMAVAPLTITAAREAVIQFTKPFMELGISIMMKKPAHVMPGAFSFLNPMDYLVWGCTVLALVSVATVLLIVQRTPDNARHCTLVNTLWFSIASIFRQETSIYPRLRSVLDMRYCSQEADMAISPLTITSERERVIDFSKPFLNLGISIMIYKPKKHTQGVFGFMSPLSTDTWICVIFAYIGVSVILYLVTRFNPTEWVQESEGRIHTQFSIPDSLWFSLASLVQQGSDRTPRSFAGRLVGSVWWFFTLILISSYTANFAAVRTVNRLNLPIKSADDLAKQRDVQYGTRASGSTMDFFKRSEIAVYKRMYEFMSTTPGVNVETYDKGIERVREKKGKYALLVESPKNDYTNQRRPCDTMKVGENLDAKGFGVATPLGSPLQHDINLIVLEAKESGALSKLEHRWWSERSECDVSNKQETSATDDELSLGSLAGIFYILIIGLVLAMTVAFVEFCYHSRRDAKKSQVSLSEAMKAKARVTIAGPAPESLCNSMH